MILDSENQRKLLLDLLLSVPISTDIRGMVSVGLPTDVVELLDAVDKAEIASDKDAEDG